MTTTSIADQHHHEAASSRVIFGFWIYILSDCVLFAVLFASYAVLQHNTFGGAGIRQVASLPYVLLETLFLLTSSFTCGMSFLAMHKAKRERVILWLAITFLLGLAFVTLEFKEFSHLIQTGNSWQRSAFLSAFFTLVGTHGVHVSVGLLWIVVLIIQFAFKGVTSVMRTRLICLSLFWHFLDIIWVLIFTIIYLMGAV